MVMIKLETIDICYSYNGHSSSPILDDVSIQLAPSMILSIVGPNGSGKSTLLKCIDRIITPYRGTVLVDRKEIMKMDRMDIAKKIGYVEQSVSRGFPTTVFDTVLMGRRPHLSWRSDEDDKEKIWEVLRLLDIEDLALKYFGELSGGQQQKILIARALAQEAEIILLDEPTSNLDIMRQFEVMDIIRDLVNKRLASVIIAIHDLNLASRYSNKIIMMKNGKIVCAGDPSYVLTRENIASVYGVEASVIRSQSDVPCIIPTGRIKTTIKR